MNGPDINLAAPAVPQLTASAGGRPAGPHPGICVGLAALVLILFGATVRHDFINFDDDQYVYQNPMVAKGVTGSGIVWAFAHSHASNWHPLTWISHMLDCELYNLDPAGHHFTSVALHAANTVLLFLLLRQLSGAHWRSAFVAALFALHPLHVESVAWVAERKDVLSAFFGLLTLLMYTRYAQKRLAAGSAGESRPSLPALGSQRPTFDYFWALLFFTLGLLSKPMLVTLPFVMLLLDWWPLRRTGSLRLVREKIPFFILSAASCLVTFLVQSRSGAAPSLESVPMLARVENAFVAYGRYLFKTLWPTNLAIPYPYPGRWPLETVGLSIALVIGASAVAIWLARRAPFVAVGWFWFLGMLVPVIGLVQVGSQSMADRYTYLPLIGVFIVLTWVAGAGIEKFRVPTAVVIAGATVILGVYAGLTWRQEGFWRNSETLFRHAIAVTGRNSVAEYNLGSYYQGNGNPIDAMKHYRKAVEIRPAYDDALNNLGVTLAMNGELDEAAARIREAIRLRPDKADAHYNLGNVLVMQHKLADAVAAYTEALRLKPDYPEAHNNLGNVLLMEGKKDEAAGHFRETLRLRPDHRAAREQLQRLGLEP